jgi:hypothetical protein
LAVVSSLVLIIVCSVMTECVIEPRSPNVGAESDRERMLEVGKRFPLYALVLGSIFFIVKSAEITVLRRGADAAYSREPQPLRSKLRPRLAL